MKIELRGGGFLSCAEELREIGRDKPLDGGEVERLGLGGRQQAAVHQRVDLVGEVFAGAGAVKSRCWRTAWVAVPTSAAESWFFQQGAGVGRVGERGGMKEEG